MFYTLVLVGRRIFSIVKSLCKGAFLPFAGVVSFEERSLRFIGSDVATHVQGKIAAESLS